MAAQVDRAVVLVHGIGSQAKGTVLSSWGRELLEWVKAVDGLDAVVARADPGQGDVHATMDLALTSGTERTRLRLIEALWADRVTEPTATELLSWSVRVVPAAVTHHLTSLLWSYPRRIGRDLSGQGYVADDSSWVRAALRLRGVLRFLWAVPASILALLAMITLVPVIIALLAALQLVAALGSVVPAAAKVAAGIQRTITRSIGDTRYIADHDIQRAYVSERVRTAIEQAQAVVGADRPGAVTVIAHSQGAAVTWYALTEGQPPSQPVHLITHGQGLAKIERLKRGYDRGRSTAAEGTAEEGPRRWNRLLWLYPYGAGLATIAVLVLSVVRGWVDGPGELLGLIGLACLGSAGGLFTGVVLAGLLRTEPGLRWCAVAQIGLARRDAADVEARLRRWMSPPAHLDADGSGRARAAALDLTRTARQDRCAAALAGRLRAPVLAVAAIVLAATTWLSAELLVRGVELVGLPQPTDGTAAVGLTLLTIVLLQTAFLYMWITREEVTVDPTGTVARWRDYYATSDPVSNGHLADPWATPTGHPVDAPDFATRAVTNRESLIRDHTTYWRNREQFLTRVVGELLPDTWRLERVGPDDSPHAEDLKAYGDRLRQRLGLQVWFVRLVAFGVLGAMLLRGWPAVRADGLLRRVDRVVPEFLERWVLAADGWVELLVIATGAALTIRIVAAMVIRGTTLAPWRGRCAVGAEPLGTVEPAMAVESPTVIDLTRAGPAATVGEGTDPSG